MANSSGLSFSVDELARIVGGQVVLPGENTSSADSALSVQTDLSVQTAHAGRTEGEISGLASLSDAGPSELSHLSSAAYAASLRSTRAGAVLLRETDLADCPVAGIVVANPYWAYAVLSARFEAPQAVADASESGKISAHALIEADVVLAPDVQVGAGAVVGSGAHLAPGCVVHANAVIGAGVQLGEKVEIHAGAVLADGVVVGAGSSIHANAVIGSEGFGYAPDTNGKLTRIAQLGGVVLGENVSVGAGSTVDRGALGDTRIGNGVKIDNQVQIGHNCVIGDHSVICGCCGIVGSTTIGAHCVLGGAVGIGGDGPITLCDGVTVSGMTHVSRSIDSPGVYSGGVLHTESRRWKRNALRFANLDSIAKRLAILEKRIRS